jgi:Xaa-Pro aminopeptidase
MKHNAREKSRLKRLLAHLTRSKVDALFVNGESNVRYLSGFTGDESFMLITRSAVYFLTDFRYAVQAKAEAAHCTLVLRTGKGYPEQVQQLCQKHKVKRLGFEANRIGLSFFNALGRAVKSSELVPMHGAVEALRLYKDKEEIEFLKKAVQISVWGVRNLEATVTPGMTEREIQAKLEYDTKMMGSEKPSFDMIVACGPNSAMPHAVSGARKVERNDLLLVDMGCVVGGYHSDLTRCFPIGKIPRPVQKIYDIVKKAQELGIKKAKPGVKLGDVDKACRGYIEKMGYAKLFGHGTGHGVGLEVHEAPNVSGRNPQVLKPGMVITVEPGIYLPGKFGVRIEDMVHITSRGQDVLTKDLEK